MNKQTNKILTDQVQVKSPILMEVCAYCQSQMAVHRKYQKESILYGVSLKKVQNCKWCKMQLPDVCIKKSVLLPAAYQALFKVHLNKCPILCLNVHYLWDHLSVSDLNQWENSF